MNLITLLIDIASGCAWIVFLLASYQSLRCSPIPVENKRLGTMFKRDTPPTEYIERIYTESLCYLDSSFPAPYRISAYTPRVRLIVNFNDIEQISSTTTPSYYKVFSDRSVKKMIYKIRLLVNVGDFEEATKLSHSFNLTEAEKRNHVAVLDGQFKHLNDDMFHLKNVILLRENKFIRPVYFKVSKTSYLHKTKSLETEIGNGSNSPLLNGILIALIFGGFIFFKALAHNARYQTQNNIYAVVYLCSIPINSIRIVGASALLVYVSIQMIASTHIVWKCSSLTLNNGDLGSWFKLKTDHNTVMRESYKRNGCFSNNFFPSYITVENPLQWSLLSPKMALVLKKDELMDMNKQKADSSTISRFWIKSPAHLFLAKSQRKVKGRLYFISLIVELPDHYITLLKETKANRLKMKGHMQKMSDDVLQWKAVWENDDAVHIRPFVFVVDDVRVL